MARERVALAAVALPSMPRPVVEDHLDELEALVDTAGGEVVLRVVQDREGHDPATCLGKGKVQELARVCSEERITLAVFDEDLTPAQVRNLEKALGLRVIDRTGLILDIFARRARSREARTQVSLAQYTYLLPRLTRAWGHLSRQAGGIGTRGVGETQLETDRRVIRRRIRHLRAELEAIAAHRRTQRRGRRTSFQVALVGYTNAGKSSLLNRLTQSDTPVEDRLFSTLDTAFRRLPLPGFLEEVLLVDTVGLVRKLPHHLVASFRSTLEQAAEADLLLHVVDVSHPAFEERARTALEVLADLRMDGLPLLTLLNKTDRTPEPILQRARALYPEALPVSAWTGTGLEALRQAIARRLLETSGAVCLFVPHDRWPEIQPLLLGLPLLARTFETEGVKVALRADPSRLRPLLSHPDIRLASL